MVSKWVMSLLGKNVEEPKSSRKVAKRKAPEKVENTAGKMKALLSRLEGTVSIGSLQMLNLDGLRETMGADWQKAGQQVQKFIEGALEAHMGDDDAFIKTADTLYVAVFGKMNETESQLMLAMIAYEIQQKLFGKDNDSHCFSVGTTTQDLEKGGTYDFVDVKDILAKAARESKNNMFEVNVHEINAAIKKTDPNSAIGNRLRKTWDGVTRPNATVWKPFENKSSPLVQRLIGNKDKIKDIGFEFSPIWSPSEKRTKGSVCVPFKESEDGSLLYGGEALPSVSADSPINIGLDYYALSYVLNTLGADADLNRKVILPVHFETLSREEVRTGYIHALQDSGLNTAKNLILEVVGMDDFTKSRIVFGLQDLLPFVNEIVPRVRLETSEFEHLVGSQVKTVAVDLSHVTMPEYMFLPLLQKFISHTYAGGFKTMAHGANRDETLEAASWAGFDYIDGSTVASTSDFPLADAAWNVAIGSSDAASKKAASS